MSFCVKKDFAIRYVNVPCVACEVNQMELPHSPPTHPSSPKLQKISPYYKENKSNPITKETNLVST